MLLELHIIQSFAPSNLNRDDTNAPKDCFFGGVRRARISSQCIKHAVRNHFAAAELLAPDELGSRTRLVRAKIAERLAKKGTADQAQAVAAAAVEAVGFKITDDGETQYLVFWGPDEIDALAKLALKYWDDLVNLAPAAKDEEVKRGKAKKKDLAKGITDDFRELAKKVLGIPKAADIALFGRMLADVPEKNVNAASQVAHALSTHKVEMEMDFYTAVDDLQTLESEEGAGAGMMGTVSFNAACFYRYANVHYDELVKNLKNDADLARKTVAAFIKSSLEAIPSGKQNTFAAVCDDART
jgi:CRISPR system Cascade subunit CasC